MSEFNEKKINKLAEEISFRLLATRKHADFNWLVKKLYLLIDSDYTKVANEENYFKKYSEKEWKYELELNAKMATELLAYQKSTPANKNWEDLVADLMALQKQSRIPTPIEFFEQFLRDNEDNKLPNQSSGSFFTGLTDTDGILSAMNFEQYDEETDEELYTDEEYRAAQDYHNMVINQAAPNWTKY